MKDKKARIDNPIFKVTMIVALPDYGGEPTVTAIDHIFDALDDSDLKMIDYQETRMALIEMEEIHSEEDHICPDCVEQGSTYK